jgi:SAM-dependent methyltransferase
MARHSFARWLVKHPLRALAARVQHCPICDRRGRFLPYRGRPNARCRHCGSLERHRLMWPVLARFSDPAWKVLHVAPESCLRAPLASRFRGYVTGDLMRDDVDIPGLDLCDTGLADCAFDMVLASHVLEHIEHDEQAIREIHRILKPGGVALLPVPITGSETIEFGEPKADELNHWRRPGSDYLDRYRALFDVEVVGSAGGGGLLPLCWKCAAAQEECR